MVQAQQKGAIITLVLVFGAVFLLLLSGLLGFILLQLRHISQRIAWHESLSIAEAGLNYYRWCQNNEISQTCPLEKNYFDITGSSLGKFSLTVNTETTCGQTTKITIISKGWTNKFPQIKRKVKALYARPSVAKFSYILNDNVWIGADHEIKGLYQSNGGIRMDGENQSLVLSSRDDWICTASFGCSSCPTQAGCQIQGRNCLCPGVFTTTGNSKPDLFDFPVPPFDFTGITTDLAEMKSIAQTSGIYLPPSVNLNPNGRGYHLKFRNDGQIEVWLITRLSPKLAYSLEEGWHYDYFIIRSEYLYNTYSPPPACSVFFVEDNIWPEGQVKGKMTVASANLIEPNLDTDIVLPGSIKYTSLDGSDGLLLISQRNVLIGPQSPNSMELKGIFIAQKGRFSRNHYPYNIREKLEITGSIVSNGRVGTKWISGSRVVSGYLQRESYFDANLVYSPPPFAPYVSQEYELLAWEEVE